VLCDLDWFKTFNDQYGHQAGDRLLASFGLLLSTRLRTGDIAARYGGEEFAIVLRDTRLADGQAVIERLHTTWAALHESVTFSSGVAAHLPGAGAAETLEAADRALYHAKASGRGCSRTAMAAAPVPPGTTEDRPADTAPATEIEGRRAGDKPGVRVPVQAGRAPLPLSL
jgi:diguanylate cyclase (GGDEF)-like protein